MENLDEAFKTVPEGGPHVSIKQVSACEEGIAALGSDNRIYLLGWDHPKVWCRLPTLDNAVELSDILAELEEA